MRLLFLGTGTSTGVPSLCCDCAVCRSTDPKNRRLRASVLIQDNSHNILIDTSTDLRQQCLAYGVRDIHSVLYTHHHADHVHGIDELRSFNHFNRTVIPCYGSEETLERIRKNFSYIFDGQRSEGGGKPQLELRAHDGNPFVLGAMTVSPLDVFHGSLTITGYRIGKMAYVTDCNGFPDDTKNQLRGLDVLVLNALGFDPHRTHFCLAEALAAIAELKPKRTFLTHINHAFDHEIVNRDLPENVELAYDGLCAESEN